MIYDQLAWKKFIHILNQLVFAQLALWFSLTLILDHVSVMQIPLLVMEALLVMMYHIVKAVKNERVTSHPFLRKALVAIALFLGLVPMFIVVIQSAFVIPISSEWGLRLIEINPEGRYELKQDIVLKDPSDLSEACMISELLGEFDGNGFAIRNVQIPLFCEFNIVRNLTLSEVDIDRVAGSGFGALGFKNNGLIANVHVFGTLRGASGIAGLVYLNAGTIVDSSFHGAIEGVGSIGGIAVLNQHTIERSYVTGSLTGTSNIGGIAADHWGFQLRDCYTDVDIVGTERLAGIVVTATPRNRDSLITNVIVLGTITGANTVGVVAINSYGIQSGAYFGGLLIAPTASLQTGVYYLQAQSFAIPENQRIDPAEVNAVLFFEVLDFDPLIWMYDSEIEMMTLITNPHLE